MEIIVALITALIAMCSLAFALWQVKRQAPLDDLNMEVGLRGIIDGLTIQLKKCNEEKDQLKDENFRLYQKLNGR